MEKEENLVKKTCRELGITQKELAEKIGVTPEFISRIANNKLKINKTIQLLLLSLIELNQVKKTKYLLKNTKIELDKMINI